MVQIELKSTSDLNTNEEIEEIDEIVDTVKEQDITEENDIIEEDIIEDYDIIEEDDIIEEIDDDYEFTTNVNKSLANILGLNVFHETNQEDPFVWEPPKQNGLTNCDYIIPKYYHETTNYQKILDIDYYEMIKDDIKNYRKLNKYQLNYIKDLSNEQKLELITIFNECIGAVQDIL